MHQQTTSSGESWRPNSGWLLQIYRTSTALSFARKNSQVVLSRRLFLFVHDCFGLSPWFNALDAFEFIEVAVERGYGKV
jgi:hypothetical protein